MSSVTSWFPQGCTYTGARAEEGSYLYVDLRTAAQGELDLALYKDSSCMEEYAGEDYTVESALQIKNGSFQDSEESMVARVSRINSLLAPFRVCQPCRTYNLSGNSDVDKYQNQGNSYGYYHYDPDMGYFQCTDQTGASGVNQCAAFRDDTGMSAASYRDMTMASSQGTIVKTHVADATQEWWQEFCFFLSSAVVFLVGL